MIESSHTIKLFFKPVTKGNGDKFSNEIMSIKSTLLRGGGYASYPMVEGYTDKGGTVAHDIEQQYIAIILKYGGETIYNRG